MTFPLPDPIVTTPNGKGLEADAVQRNFDKLAQALDGLRLGGGSSIGSLPGDLKISAATTTPVGWLPCDGAAVSRTTYARLFAAIGTSFGVGDGSTTFNVPDLRGRAPVGDGDGDASGHTNHVFGTKYGKETHVLATSEMPSHTHQPVVYDARGAGGGTGGAILGRPDWGPNFGLADDGSNIAAKGGGGAHENRTPSLAVKIYVKT